MSHLHGPRARFNDLISQIITSQEIDGSELLIIIGMLRERTLREEFLDCLHTKAPYFRLSLLSYNHLLDVMRALLREANNSGDFKSIAAVFTTSRLYGRNVGGFVYSIMKSLPSHEVWSNVSFWMYCTDELISEDIIRWDDLSSNSRKFLNLPDSQVYIFLAINRIHSVAFSSMMAVGVSTTVIRSFIETASESYGFDIAHLDLSKSPCEEFVVWLLDTLIEQHSKSQKNSRNEGLNNVEGIAIPTKIDTRTKRAVLGYSSIQELVFQIAEKQRKRFNSDDYLCMCGLPLGVWQPLGLFDERVAHRKDLSSFVCEACFRQMTTKLSTASMVIGDTGRCVVPNTPSRRPESFLSIYYGSSAALNKFRGTTGQLVGLHLLSSEKLLSQVSEQNSFLRSEKKGMSAVRGRSNKYANKKGDGDGTSRTTSTQSELEVSDDDSVVSDISESDASTKGILHGVNLLDVSNGVTTPGGTRSLPSEEVNRAELTKFIALMQSGVDVVKISNSPFTRHITRTLFLDRAAQRLCWLPPGRAQLTPEEGHFVPVYTIQNIKIGTGKFEQCVSIITEKKTLLIKIEEIKLFSQIVEGLLLICEMNKSKKNRSLK